jgi:putative transcriptional regulator
MKNQLKVGRAILDLTQEDLAKKVGVSRQTINSIEKGRYVPSTILALKIATIFEKPVDEVFQLEREDWET